MSLARADLADDQQAHAIARVVLLRELRSGEMSKRQRGIGSGKICRITGKFTMLVASKDVRRRQQSLVSSPQLAVAARDSPVFGRARAGGKSLPSCAFAEGTNLGLRRRQHQSSS